MQSSSNNQPPLNHNLWQFNDSLLKLLNEVTRNDPVSFRTDMPGQTVQTQISQGLHCLPFSLHRLDSLFYGRAT